MFNSLRTRLTLWYSGVLALVLLIFAGFAYFFLARSVRQITDDNLSEVSRNFINTALSELDDADSETEESPVPSSQTNKTVAALSEASDELRLKNYRIFIFDANQNLVVQPNATADEEDLSAGDIAALTVNDKQLATINQNKFRVLIEKFILGGQNYTLLAAHSLTEENFLLEQMQTVFAVGVPLALLLATGGGYFLARKSLAPIAEMSRQANRITAENLHERLSVTNPSDELGKLAVNFNDLLIRLDESFLRQRRFMADASHELRTPLAILRGEAEVTLSKNERTPADYRESLSIVQDEASRMTRIVEDLFLLARADAGQMPLKQTLFYLDETAENCVRKLRTMAENRQISLSFDRQSKKEMQMRGDEELLCRMLLNLLDNAIKYTPTGGSVVLTAAAKNNFHEIEISDSGSGIPSIIQSDIFERFFRADEARSRSDENSGGSGAGLGLAIARRIAEAHCGTLTLKKSDEHGSVFAVIFPAENF